jgi:hypothetical protein
LRRLAASGGRPIVMINTARTALSWSSLNAALTPRAPGTGGAAVTGSASAAAGRHPRRPWPAGAGHDHIIGCRHTPDGEDLTHDDARARSGFRNWGWCGR